MADPSIHAELAAIRDQIARLERDTGRLGGAFEGLRDARKEQTEALAEDADRQRDAIIEFTNRLSALERTTASREEIGVLTKRVDEVESAADKIGHELELIRALAQQPWKWAERIGVLVAIVTSIAVAWATIKALPARPDDSSHTEQHPGGERGK